jgi:hypothetical protein
MKDYTPRDLEYFTEKLWSSVGIPERYLDGTKNADMLERILKKRKRISRIKSLWKI